MAEAPNLVHVEIFGQTYAVRGADAAHVEQLGKYVDEQMQQISRSSGAVDSVRIAVLAALNIADEFFRACDDVETDQAALNRRAAALERMVDLALGLEQPQAAAR
jgi:cell division protein ZapA